MVTIDKIIAISELTFKKIKEPAFLLLFLISAFFGLFCSEMNAMSLSLNDSFIDAIFITNEGIPPFTGFVMIFLLSMLIALFEGTTSIPRDIESRMIMIILSKPVERYEYLIGKFIGVASLCIINFIIAFITAFFAHYIRAGDFYSFDLVIRQLMLMLLFFPFVSIVIFISTFLSDIPAMIVAVFYVILSIGFSVFIFMLGILPVGLDLFSVVYVFYYLFPNYLYYFNSFDIFSLVSLSLIGYTLSISVIFLTLATIRIKKRDMI